MNLSLSYSWDWIGHGRVSPGGVKYKAPYGAINDNHGMSGRQRPALKFHVIHEYS